MLVRNSASLFAEENIQFLLLPFIPPYIISYSHRDSRIKPAWTWTACPVLLLFTSVLKAAVSDIQQKTSVKSSTKPKRDAKNAYKQQLAPACSHRLIFKFSMPKGMCIFYSLETI